MNPELSWASMFDALPAAIYVIDAQGTIAYFNRAAAEFAGRTPRLGGDRWCVSWKLYHADGRPMPHQQCPAAVALREGRPISGVTAIAERPDGTRVWFQSHATPLLDSQGRVVGGVNMLLDVTGRREDDAAKWHLAAIVESSEDAIITKDLTGRITSWNAGAERLFGYSASEAIGQPVTMLMPPDRVNEEPGILDRVRRGQRIEHYETIRRCKDGTLIDISLTVSPIKDPQGQIVGASKIARDITNRRRAEKAVRESEKRFRALVQATTDAVYRMSPDWRVMRQLDGRGFMADTTEPTSNWIETYVPPSDRAAVLAAIEHATRTRTVYDLEHRVIRPDGTIGWTHARAVPVLDEQGEVVEWFGAASDVTRRKQAEEDLAHQRRMYEGVLSTTPDLAYIFDLDHRFIYANEGQLRTWGRSWDEAIGKSFMELGYEPWHAELHNREIDEVVATKKPIRGIVPFTGTFGRRLYDYIFTPVLDEQGRVQAVAGTTRDVTDIKQVEDALRQSEALLATELQSMRRLHELSIRLTQTDDIDQAMREAMSAAAQLMGATRCAAHLLDPEKQCLRLVAVQGFDADFAERLSMVTADGCTTCAAAMNQRRRILVPDLARSTDFDKLRDLAEPIGVRAAMSTPLLSAKGELQGVFTTYWDTPHAPSEHQLRLLDLYVQQAARQLERRASEQSLRRSEEQLEAQVADLEALRQLTLRVAATDDRATALDDILQTALGLLGAAKGNIQLFDPADETLKIIAQRGFDEEFLEHFRQVPAGYSCCGAAMARRERIIIEDVSTDPRFAQLAEVYTRHGFIAVQSTPLFTATGRLLGMFSTHFAHRHRPSERELRLLDQMAQQAGRVIERTRAEEALRSHARILETLNRVGASLSADLDTQKIIQTVTDAGTQLSGAQFGAFFFNAVNDQDQAYTLYTLSGAPRDAFEKLGIPRNTPVFAPTFAGERTVRSDDITTDPRYGRLGPHHGMPEGHLPVRSYLAVPVISRSGEVLGGLFFGHPDAGVFTPDAERLVEGLAAQAAIAVDNARLYEEARASEERFRTLAENIPQLAWTARPDGHIYWYNRRWYEYTGATPESQEGWGWKAVHHPDYVDAVLAKWRRAMQTGEHWEDTFPLRGRDGQYRWFLSRAFPIRDAGGAIVQWFGTNTDITAQREAEEELRRHRDTLQQRVAERTREIMEAQERLRFSERMASLGTLSAGLGHDMGNLLVPVRVHLESLSSLDLPSAAREELEGIRSSVEYLRRLAGGLRQLAVDPSRSQNREPTELREWWNEAATLLKNALPRGVRLESFLPDQECWIAMSRPALTQAIFNLVQNAGDALRDRGHGVVEIRVQVGPESVQFSVADDGPGMDEDVKRRCIEPFFTTKARGVSTGLGLALVFGLIQEVGGTIDLRSAPGQGTTFTLSIARAKTDHSVHAEHRVARVCVQDPRLRAIVSAELRSLAYHVDSGTEPRRHAEIVVSDRIDPALDASARMVLLCDGDNAPASALVLGASPKVHIIREALRTIAAAHGSKDAPSS